MTLTRTHRPKTPGGPPLPARAAAAILLLCALAWVPGASPGLEAGSFVAGQVVDPEGAPIRGASIHVWEAPRPLGAPTPQGGPASWGPVSTGTDGTFRVSGMAPGEEVRIQVLKEGYAVALLRGVRAPTDEPIRVVLWPAAALSGVVADEQDRLLPRARVRRPSRAPGVAEPGPGAEVSGRVVEPDGSPGRHRELQLTGGPTVFDSRTYYATAAADGAFVFRGVRDGKYRLTVVDDLSPVWIVPDAISVEEGGAVTGVEVRPEPTLTLTGRLLGLEADELRGAAVLAMLLEPGLHGSRHGEVLEDGSYRVTGLAPASWTVLAEAHGSGRQALASVELEPGQREGGLDLEFQAGFSVTGSVFTEGEPLLEAAVRLVGLSVSLSIPTITDYRGRFRIEGVPAGRYSLRVEKAGFAPHASHLEVVGGDAEAAPVFLEPAEDP